MYNIVPFDLVAPLRNKKFTYMVSIGFLFVFVFCFCVSNALFGRLRRSSLGLAKIALPGAVIAGGAHYVFNKDYPGAKVKPVELDVAKEVAAARRLFFKEQKVEELIQACKEFRHNQFMKMINQLDNLRKLEHELDSNGFIGSPTHGNKNFYFDPVEWELKVKIRKIKKDLVGIDANISYFTRVCKRLELEQKLLEQMI